MTWDEAIDVFVRGFSATRSRANPYRVWTEDGVRVCEDDPPRTKGGRKIEIASHGRLPSEVVDFVRNHKLGRHMICHLHNDGEFEKIRGEYKSLGYRAVSTEWMFFHDLKTIPEYRSDPMVKSILSVEQLQCIPQRAAQPRKFYPPARLFGIFDESTDYGWVESIPVGSDGWVSALHVHESDRGKGYGRALMSALLQSDKENGIRHSVLLASAAGNRLYPHLGYQRLGMMQLFCLAKGHTTGYSG